ncbi:MAG: hypothetical protein HYX33_00675 [Actinobacteria bacterium]|nr:hypothetical protein [Actinomycetota bacterium]
MTRGLRVVRVGEGLWQWTIPHPAWTPATGEGEGGWPRRVASTYAEVGGGIVLVDPILPNAAAPDAERFWRHLDADVARVGGPPTTIVTCRRHARGAKEVRERFGGPVVAVAADAPDLDGLVTRVARDGEDVGPGSLIVAVDGPGNAECLVFLPAHRTLVAGDVIRGGPQGRLTWAPPAWDVEGADHAVVRISRHALIERLLALDPRRVLVSHGEGVSRGTRDALAALRADLAPRP